MKSFIKYLKRIGWVLLVIAIIPLCALIGALFFVLSPLAVAIIYVVKWDDFFEAVAWVFDDFLEEIYDKLFGWVFTIRPF